MKKEVTQKEIRKQTGKCNWCEKKQVDWFCSECWWGVCNKCAEFDGTWGDKCFECMSKAAEDVEFLADVTCFKK